MCATRVVANKVPHVITFEGEFYDYIHIAQRLG